MTMSSNTPAQSSQSSVPSAGRQLEVQRLAVHRDRLFRAACALCRLREDAEDLVQETYASVLKRPGFVRRDDDLAYLLRVLRNAWINNHRARSRKRQRLHPDDSIEFSIYSVADPSASMIDMRNVYESVRRLSEPLRDALVAVDIVGLSYKQAARVLGTREGAVLSRLYRAREQVATRHDPPS